MSRRRATALSRHDIEQRTDRPTNSLVLQYVGSSIRFEEDLYGYPEGVFFAVSLDEVPLPPELAELAERWHLNVDSLPDVKNLRRAVAECLAAHAAVQAPEMLLDLAQPETFWQPWDERELERKHRIAGSKVERYVRLVENEIRLRASGLTTPKVPAVHAVDPGLGPPPPPAYAEPKVPEEDCPEPPPAQPPVVIIEQPEGASDCPPTDCGPGEESAYLPASLTVKRARAATTTAREYEIPQRLPTGARRLLKQLPPGAYVSAGQAMDVRSDLCAAMTDARNRGRKGREASVIDWDGEWPVVVRRYGKGGRTIYKVETALKRHGVEIPEVK